MNQPREKLKRLDHIAIAVADTEAALTHWRDRLGFAVVHQEAVNGGTVLLTHLDLGNVDLQLVEPLSDDHPLHGWLAERGSGLHHLCFEVDNVEDPLGIDWAPAPHQGIKGKRARFLGKDVVPGTTLEITGA